MLLYKVSVKTFVKHRPISCSKERKPRDKILLTSVWDVTKTKNGDRRTSTGNGKLKKWEQGRELEIKSLFPFFIFPFPILFPRSPFPVPRDIAFGWVGRYCEDKTSLFSYDLWPMLRLGIVHNDRVCSDVRHHRAPISLRVRFRLTSTTFFYLISWFFNTTAQRKQLPTMQVTINTQLTVVITTSVETGMTKERVILAQLPV